MDSVFRIHKVFAEPHLYRKNISLYTEEIFLTGKALILITNGEKHFPFESLNKKISVTESTFWERFPFAIRNSGKASPTFYSCYVNFSKLVDFKNSQFLNF